MLHKLNKCHVLMDEIIELHTDFPCFFLTFHFIHSIFIYIYISSLCYALILFIQAHAFSLQLYKVFFTNRRSVLFFFRILEYNCNKFT